MTTDGAVAHGGAGLAPRSARSSVPAPAGRGETRLRFALVLFFFGLLGAAALLSPTVPGSEGGLTVAGKRLPEVCALYRTTGLPCPGCGLTRSWVSVLHGEMAASLRHHALGWLVLLYVAAQLVRHAAWLVLPRLRSGTERLGGRLDRGVIVLGVLLFVVWIPRFLAAAGAR